MVRGVREPKEQGLAAEQVIAERLSVGDLPLHVAPRLVVCQATRAKRVVEVFELGGPFVDNLLLAIGGQGEWRHVVAHEACELRHSRGLPPVARRE